MRKADYPALYLVADAASQRGQAWYRRWVKAQLQFVVAGAAIGAAAPRFPAAARPYAASLSAVLLLGAIVSTRVSKGRADDRDWFIGRAVAETMKSETWRYMLRHPPFDDDASADREWARQAEAIRRLADSPAVDLRAGVDPTPQITARMRAVRQLPLRDRRDVYARERLRDQADWYGSKARLNGRLADRWCWAALAGQTAALAFAVARIVSDTGGVSLVGVFGALAAAATAWTQLGRHDELRQSYALASRELRTITGLADAVRTEDDLQGVVRDGEAAISREHTMWITKRGELLPPSVTAAGATPRGAAGHRA